MGRIVPVLMVVFSARWLMAGQFHFGFAGARGDMAKLQAPRPPVIFTGKKQVTVEVIPGATVAAGGINSAGLNGVAQTTQWTPAPSPGTGTTAGGYDPNASYGNQQPQRQVLSEMAAADLGAIRIAVEQILAPHYTIVQAAPEAIFRVHVAGYDPVRTQQYAIQQTVKDPNTGQPVQVPVDVWEGTGRLPLRVELVDPATNRVIDGFAPNAEYKQRGAIAVAGQQRVDPSTLPIADGIWKGMVREVVAPFTERYTATVEGLEFNLATDEELRPGNQFAKNHYWQQALESWEKATIAKKENEGDKVFNIGAAHEALAYDALRGNDVPKAKQLFEKAVGFYNEAARLDPKEKFITSAGDRMKKTVVYLNRAIQQSNATVAAGQEQQRVQQDLEAKRQGDEAAAALAQAGQEAKLKAFSTPRADTIAEASFRKLVKVRLRALNAPAGPDEQAKLQAMGPLVYKLQADEAERVVFQESGLWAEALPRIAQYKETFAALFADKRIAPDERDVLKQLAAALALPPEEAQAVEAQFAPPPQ